MKRRQMLLGLVSGLVVAALLFVNCSKVMAASPNPKAKTVKIGFIFPITGGLAQYYPGNLAGLQVGLEKITKDGGWLGGGVTVIVRDEQTPDVAARTARELIEVEHVDMITGVMSSACALTVAGVVKELKTIWMASQSKTDKITAELFTPYTFRTGRMSTVEGRNAAQIVASKFLQGKTNPKVALIGSDYEYGHTVWDAFVVRIKKLVPGVQIVYEGWTKTTETDFGSVIQVCLGHKPDAVYCIVPSAPALVSQAKSYGFFEKTRLITAAEVISSDIQMKLGAEWPAGIWGNAHSADFLPTTKVHKEYYQALREKTGLALPYNQAYVQYLAVLAYGRAVQKAQTTDTETIIRTLETMTIDAPGTPTGKFSFRKLDHVGNAAQVWGETMYDPKLKFNVINPATAQLIMDDKAWRSEAEVRALMPPEYRNR